MTFTKAGIVRDMHSRLGITINQSAHAVETILKISKESWGSGDDGLISGFGKFCVKAKYEPMGRNSGPGGADDIEA